MTEIQSKSNERLKRLTELARSKHARDQKGVALVDGGKLCLDAVRTGHSLLELWITEYAYQKEPEQAQQLCAAAEEIFLLKGSAADRISDLKSPQGVWGVFRRPAFASPESLYTASRVLGIAEIQNPENAGAMIRTASALGYDGIIVSSETADLWSPRVLRAGALAQFNIPIAFTDDLVRIVVSMKEAGFLTCASALDESASSVQEIPSERKIFILIGNEGHGLPADLIKACEQSVYLPMSNGVDSLNANAAAAILMWELRRK
jgi:TrmH family RNA methyltransferase